MFVRSCGQNLGAIRSFLTICTLGTLFWLFESRTYPKSSCDITGHNTSSYFILFERLVTEVCYWFDVTCVVCLVTPAVLTWSWWLVTCELWPVTRELWPAICVWFQRSHTSTDSGAPSSWRGSSPVTCQPNIWYLTPDTWHLTPDTWHWYLSQVTWHLKHPYT